MPPFPIPYGERRPSSFVGVAVHGFGSVRIEKSPIFPIGELLVTAEPSNDLDNTDIPGKFTAVCDGGSVPPARGQKGTLLFCWNAPHADSDYRVASIYSRSNLDRDQIFGKNDPQINDN
jgi:hypothetical protein